MPEPLSPESPLPESKLVFSMSRSLHEQTMLSARLKGTGATEIIRRAVSLRRCLEAVRDEKMYDYRVPPMVAKAILDFSYLAASIDAEDIASSNDTCDVIINVPPAMLSELDEAYLHEGFSSVSDYVSASLLMYHMFE